MKKIVIFFSGILTAGVVISLIIGSAYLFYRFGAGMLDRIDAKEEAKRAKYIKLFVPGAVVSFELNTDTRIFSAQESSTKVSKDFASDGINSLLVELPSGTSYPGLRFEVNGKNCLDWSRMKELSFDIFNNVSRPARITLKFKSGAKYPKRILEREYGLPPLKWTKIVLRKEELDPKLDLSKISYMGIYMHDPITTFLLYFDNFRIER